MLILEPRREKGVAAHDVLCDESSTPRTLPLLLVLLLRLLAAVLTMLTMPVSLYPSMLPSLDCRPREEERS